MGEKDSQDTQLSDFEDLRRLAFSIAYRMLGSVAEAEDVVQDALLRLHNARSAEIRIDSSEAYLATITTRLSIDCLRSARMRRETYTGSWLPEPLVEEPGSPIVRQAEMMESLSMAFLVVLEALSPVERAVFLLRQVFDYSYDEIAETIGKSVENCRQIFVRAKRHVDEGKPRFEPSREKRNELAKRFLAACQHGELENLISLLAKDAVFVGDGGGKAVAVTQPVRGSDSVARLMLGTFAKGRQLNVRFNATEVNGQPGLICFDAHNRVISVMALDIADGQVRSVRSVINPDKLTHLGVLSDWALLPKRGARKRAE